MIAQRFSGSVVLMNCGRNEEEIKDYQENIIKVINILKDIETIYKNL